MVIYVVYLFIYLDYLALSASLCQFDTFLFLFSFLVLVQLHDSFTVCFIFGGLVWVVAFVGKEGLGTLQANLVSYSYEVNSKVWVIL